MRLMTLSLVLLFSPDASSLVRGAQPQSPDKTVFVNPTRRAPDGPPAAPPELPAGADQVDPLTFEMITTHTPRKGKAASQRQVVSRTKDRIHIATAGKEWLFEQNPVDARRVSAYLVHHDAKTVVLHEESDLRNTLGITGWADVLTVGTDPASPHALTPRAFTVRHDTGVTSVAIRKVRAGVNADLLRDPASRFAGYKALDLAEWLEGARGTRPRTK